MRRGAPATVAWALGLLLATVPAAAMPPQSAPSHLGMSGIPLPSPDLPPGTVTVRVVRGGLSQSLAGITVTLQAAAGRPSQSAVTDAAGRAHFGGVTGAQLTATATVAGTTLRSQPFALEGAGGVRLLLVAAGGAPSSAPGAAGSPATTTGSPETGLPPGHPTVPGMAPGAAGSREGALPPGHPAIPGAAPSTQPASLPAGPTTSDPRALTVAKGSRLVLELVESSVKVTAAWLVHNEGPTFVAAAGGLRIELPDGVAEVVVDPHAAFLRPIGNDAVALTGPVPPGETRLLFQYVVPFRETRLSLRHVLPLNSDGMIIVMPATELGVEVENTVAQEITEEETDSPTALYATAPQPAGGAVVVQLSKSRVLAWVTGGVMILLLLWLGWAWGRSGSTRALMDEREELLTSLTELTLRQEEGAPGEQRAGPARQRLLERLEAVSRQLDEGGPA